MTADGIDEAALRAIGRSAAEAAGSRRVDSLGRELMRVTKVSGDTIDLDCGDAAHPMPVLGVPVTSGCAGVRVGDVAVVDTLDHKPIAIGVMGARPGGRAPGDTVALDGRVHGLSEAGFNDSGAWRYKVLAKSDRKVDDVSLSGNMRVRGSIGGFGGGSIDVGCAVRGASRSDLSVDAIGPGVIGSTLCRLLLVVSDGYLHAIVCGKGYYRYDLVLEGTGFHLVDSAWASTRPQGDVLFNSGSPDVPSADMLGGYPAKLGLKGSYWGLRAPGEAPGGWIRTTESGLIPYENGRGALGTQSFKFSEVWGEDVIADRLRRPTRRLWSGSGYYMAASHEVALSETVSSQATGIVLHWQEYEDGATRDYGHSYQLVPKRHAQAHAGKGVAHFIVNSSGGTVGVKYVYVSDTTIKGNDYNKRGRTAMDSGINVTPNRWVLTEVLGV